VDFWDLTKVLIRRWMITLPLLMISAALTVLTVGQVRPDYVATAYAHLVPPAPTPTGPERATPAQRNPWLGLELTAIGDAAIVMVTDQSVIDEMEVAGYSGSYTIQMGSSSPLATFEVTGESERQASESAGQLVLRFSRSVAALQRAYDVAPQDSITVRRLDLGTNVHESDANVKRVLVAVATASLLMTVAVTVGLDALLRRRRARKDTRATATPPLIAPGSDEASAAPAVATGTTAPPGAGDDGRPDGVTVEHRNSSRVVTTAVDTSGRKKGAKGEQKVRS
jgi:hypothetical protein